jgi:thiol-disulfide isomerase/thioredoxin
MKRKKLKVPVLIGLIVLLVGVIGAGVFLVFNSSRQPVNETEAENERGGYYAHKEGESVADSLLVELLKDNQNKVVLIDFWNTWCGPCRGAIKDMEPMKAEFEDKDVVFMYLADMTSPENEYNELIPTIKGLHHRLPNSDVDALKRKWGFTGIPAYVLIGKDGMVKDFGGYGTDYFRQKINAELEK